MIPDINRKVDLLVEKMLNHPVTEKEKIEISDKVPEGFITTRNFEKLYKFISDTSILFFIRQEKYDQEKVFWTKSKKLFFDPVYFLNFFLSNCKTKRLMNSFRKFVQHDPALKNLDREANRQFWSKK